MAINCRKTKSGKIKYVVRVVDRYGRWYRSKTFDRKSEAQSYERSLQEKACNYEPVDSPILCKKTVNEFFAEWFEHREHKVSKGWHVSQIRMYQTYVEKHLGKMKLRDVTTPKIGFVLSKMYSKKLSSQSVLHVFNLMNRAFKDAVDYFSYIEKNPISQIDRPKLHRVEREYLTPDESWRLLNHCRENYIGPAIWLAILSGLRISEIQALRWKSIDFEKRQILICEAFKRSIGEIEPYPKQKDWALVPLPVALHDFLRDLSKQKFPADFVAPAKYSGMLDHSKFYRGLRKLTNDLDLKPVSPHGLRHSCTEIWFKNGANLEDVRRLLNHKSSETTQRYVHRTNDRLLELSKTIVEPQLKNITEKFL